MRVEDMPPGPSVDEYLPLDAALRAYDLRQKVVAISQQHLDEGRIRKGVRELADLWRKVGLLSGDGRVCNDWQIRQYAGLIPPARAKEWCGGFALLCYHEAGITDVPWLDGRGFAFRLPQIQAPLPGDLFVTRTALAHHGIVVSRKLQGSDLWLESIEGNTPGISKRYQKEPQNLTYYSIEPWVRAALA